MYAVLSRGGMRQFKVPSQKPETNQTISAPEAQKLLLARRGWENMRVSGALDFANSSLDYLPDGLQCASLNVSNCPELQQIPNRLETRFLDISSNPQILVLPESTVIHSVLEIAKSGLRGLPSQLRVRLHWEGVLVSERIAFYPETISGQDVLREDNLETRRIMLERIGYERLMLEVGGLILDRDTDTGGERKLIRIPLDDDEDIMIVAVFCPSTNHQYVLRVPPYMRSCRQAVAWIAGFENERDYQVILEA
jgi:hypothetical protein